MSALKFASLPASVLWRRLAHQSSARVVEQKHTLSWSRQCALRTSLRPLSTESEAQTKNDGLHLSDSCVEVKRARKAFSVWFWMCVKFVLWVCFMQFIWCVQECIILLVCPYWQIVEVRGLETTHTYPNDTHTYPNNWCLVILILICTVVMEGKRHEGKQFLVRLSESR